MRRIVLAALLAPPAFILFLLVHEGGHTLVARLLGDAQATFYLIRFSATGNIRCIGCNITDYALFSPWESVLVSLGGLLATQAMALAGLGLLLWACPTGAGRRALAALAGGYVMLDVPVQVVQALRYPLEGQIWPTNVDLLDVLLRLQAFTGWSESALKALLLGAGALYLLAFFALYRKALRLTG
ncbi:MAG: hypothetical protein D6803_05265 [Anaerolineae bacterium]|nr:MAG: hypothetical protein D6803_05265 [Anaerolineae bacterium]